MEWSFVTMNVPNLQNPASMSGESDEYSDGILSEFDYLSDQHDHLYSPNSGDPDRPGYHIPTRDDIYENKSPYSFDNNRNDYETTALNHDYNSPNYGENKVSYSVPTSNRPETETQNLNYGVENHSEDFSPYSINSRQGNNGQSWEYSNQYSLSSFQNPLMNEPQLQKNSSLEDSEEDDNNRENSNLSQNGNQNGYQNGTQNSIQTFAANIIGSGVGFSFWSLGLSMMNGESNVIHHHTSSNIHFYIEGNTDIHGDKIEQQGSFGTGINVGEVENQNTNVDVGFDNRKIKADTLGNINELQEKTRAETLPEINQFIPQLEKFNPIEIKIPNLTLPEHIEMMKNNFALREPIIRIGKPLFGNHLFRK